MLYSELYNRFSKVGVRINRSKFTNEHGEDYVVIDIGGYTVFIAGHETDWEVIPLFNDKFNIWSQEELYKLGVALKELYDPTNSREQS